MPSGWHWSENVWKWAVASSTGRCGDTVASTVGADSGQLVLTLMPLSPQPRDSEEELFPSQALLGWWQSHLQLEACHWVDPAPSTWPVAGGGGGDGGRGLPEGTVPSVF